MNSLSRDIANKFTQAKSQIRVLAFIHRLTRLGICFGFAILFITISIINGFEKVLDNQFLKIIPQAMIFKGDKQVFNQALDLQKEIARFGNVTRVEPTISQPIIIEAETKRKLISAFGILPASYQTLTALEQYSVNKLPLTVSLASKFSDNGLEQIKQKISWYRQNLPEIFTKLIAESTEADPDLDLEAATEAISETTTPAKTETSNPQAAEAQISDTLEEVFANTPTIVLGKQLASILGVQIGDYVRVFSSSLDLEAGSGNNQYFVVADLIDSGGLFDKELVLTNIYDLAQVYNRLPEACGSWQLNLKQTETSACKADLNSLVDNYQLELANPYQEIDVSQAGAWNSYQNHDLRVVYWKNIYPNIARDIPNLKSVLNLALIFVILLSAFNLICSILIVVKDKKKSIAILQALGLNQSKIHQIFIWYSLKITMTATILGVLLGLGFGYGLHYLSFSLLNSGLEVIDGSNYFINYLPFEPSIISVVIVCAAMFVVSIVVAYCTSKIINSKQTELSLLS